MESHGVPGTIQISRATYELLKDNFTCQPRGVVQVKGKGEMETFYLTGRRAGRTQYSAPFQVREDDANSEQAF
jgi:class 3 adenylate cyclase